MKQHHTIVMGLSKSTTIHTTAACHVVNIISSANIITAFGTVHILATTMAIAESSNIRW